MTLLLKILPPKALKANGVPFSFLHPINRSLRHCKTDLYYSATDIPIRLSGDYKIIQTTQNKS